MAGDVVSSHGGYGLHVSGGCDREEEWKEFVMLAFGGTSHFLWANLGGVYCYYGDEQPGPTQHSLG